MRLLLENSTKDKFLCKRHSLKFGYVKTDEKCAGIVFYRLHSEPLLRFYIILRRLEHTGGFICVGLYLHAAAEFTAAH